MLKKTKNILFVFAISALIALAGHAAAEVKATYLYNLSDFTGILPTSSAKVSVDPFNKEVFVTTGDLIRVFNDKGMLLFSFGEDLNAGVLFDAAADEKGNIYVLSHSYERKSYIITLCNYRGEPIREISVTNIPPQAERFSPNGIIYRNGSLYLFSDYAMMVLIADANGVFKEQVDLFPLMDIKPEKSPRRRGEQKPGPVELNRADYGISGFSVDHEGNFLFASPVTAKVHIVFPDRKADSFGKRGSAPGRFGVPRGVARDKAGNYLVSDILRSVVMIFNKDFDFITEFGGKGYQPGRFIGPTGISVDEDSKVYVTQLAERGVSVFKLEGN
jgi:DNA-binding beta-propeller fold protein YncE